MILVSVTDLDTHEVREFTMKADATDHDVFLTLLPNVKSFIMQRTVLDGRTQVVVQKRDYQRGEEA